MLLERAQGTGAEAKESEYLHLNLVLFFKNLFIWPRWVLVVACGIFNLGCGMQDLQLRHTNFSSSLTRDQTWAPGTDNAEA